MYDIFEKPQYYAVYTLEQCEAIKATEAQSSLWLIDYFSQQMAHAIQQVIQKEPNIPPKPRILIWCGTEKRYHSIYLTAIDLQQQGFNITIIDDIAEYQHLLNVRSTIQYSKIEQLQENNPLNRITFNQFKQLNTNFDIHIDVLFDFNAQNPQLSQRQQALIDDFNQQQGYKIAIDYPSGLNPNTGQTCSPLERKSIYSATCCDLTLCLAGVKLGVLMGKGRQYAGKIMLITMPNQAEKNDYQHIDFKNNIMVNTAYPRLPNRVMDSHKGDYGHVLIIGGHANMGGAVIMAGESAMACGAGKVTIMCHQKHHLAILSRSPNIMLKDIDDIFDESFSSFLEGIDCVAFGMGLGRDAWAKQIYHHLMPQLRQREALLKILDADALYFLAQYPQVFDYTWFFTPHDMEASRLLACEVQWIAHQRITIIQQLQEKYAGNWVLKGVGSLTLEGEYLEICPYGNAGMATAGMGDILSGVIAGLKARKMGHISLADCVKIHALAGDELAKTGVHGLQAYEMPKAIYKVINHQ